MTESDHQLLRRELARSEAERARAESVCERLRRAQASQQNVETRLRIDLERAVAAQAEAQRTVQLALGEIAAMREIWVHAHLQLDLERQRRRAEGAQLSAVTLEVADLQSARAERDVARAELAAVTSTKSWAITRPIRVANRFARRLRFFLS